VNQMEVVLYVSSKRSLRCWRAKGLLARKGYCVKVIHTTNEELRELLLPFGQGLSHKKSVPYVFIDHRPGGDLSVQAPSNVWCVARYRRPRQVG
jgi:glutaredoxin